MRLTMIVGGLVADQHGLKLVGRRDAAMSAFAEPILAERVDEFGSYER